MNSNKVANVGVTSVPVNKPLFTKWIRKAITIGNVLRNPGENSNEELEKYLTELYDLFEHEGVILSLVELQLHQSLINLIKLDSLIVKKLCVQLLQKVINYSAEIKEGILKNTELISNLAEVLCSALQSQNRQILEECILKLMVDLFQFGYPTGTNNLSIENLVINCIASTVRLTTINTMLAVIILMDSVSETSFGVVERYLSTNMKQLLNKWRSNATNHKLGIAMCKLIWKSIKLSDSKQIFCVAFENNIESVLLKILFELHLTISSKYYLECLKLLYGFLTCWPDKLPQKETLSTKEFILTTMDTYRPIILKVLMETIKRYRCTEITDYGLRLVYLTLSVTDDINQTINEADQLSWLTLIQEVLQNNINSSNNILEWSFKVLQELFTLNIALIRLIGNHSDPNNLLLDSTIMQIVYSKATVTVESFCACCKLTEIMAAHSENVQNRLLECNFHAMMHYISLALIDSNTKNANQKLISPEIKQENICRIYSSLMSTMRAVILFNYPAKELMFNEQTLFQLSKRTLIESHQTSSKHTALFYSCIENNILFLASLAEFSPFKYDMILSKNISLTQLFECDLCSKNEAVVESLQELFIVMCGSDSENDIILDLWPLEKWLDTASRLIRSYAVQKNMMILLQLNVGTINAKKPTLETLNSISNTIYRAIKMHKDSLVLLTESIVLIQLFAKQTPTFIPICLNEHFNFDFTIFDAILETNNTRLINIATHAFYVLSASNIFRVLMIKKAVKMQKIELIQCLVTMGTDISKLSTDLLLTAVKQKPESISMIITAILLRNGCNPDRAVITACQEAGNTSVMGLLLCCYGVFESDNGHILKWDNLHLDTAQKSWFTVLYQGIPDNTSNNKIISICSKIQMESKNRMKLRQLHTKSRYLDTNQTRYPFTHNRSLVNNIDGIYYQSKPQKSQEYLITHNLFLSVEGGSLPYPASKEYLFEKLGSSLLQYNPNVRPKLDIDLANRKNTQSEENLWLKNNIKKNNKEDFTYKPLAEEVNEFYFTFRSGADYLYNTMDPRCLSYENVSICPTQYRYHTIQHFTSRPNMDWYIKLNKSCGQENNEQFYSSSWKSPDSAAESVGVTLRQISDLDMSNNQLISINFFPDQHDLEMQLYMVNMVKSISVLKLSGNAITEIPKHVWELLPNLKTCDLNRNQITQFPWELFKHCEVDYLNMGNNKLRLFKMEEHEKAAVVDEEKLQQLKNLSLEDNAFEEFDYNSLSLFSNLEVLKLQRAKLKINPESFIKLPNLKKLYLNDNTLNTIHDNFLEQCHSLSLLELSHNNLSTINNSFPIPLNNYNSLTVLDFSYNNLACKQPHYIPKEILQISNLKVLKMSFNKLTHFPPSYMWKSTTIEQLDFSNNFIEEINLLNASTNFANLHQLDISNNLLKKLPTEIGYLNELNYLNISNNMHLRTLPDSIGLLQKKKLNTLLIENLNLDLPHYLKNKNSKLMEILKYYYNRLRRSSEYYTLKLLVLGYANKGKTSLLAALKGQKIKKLKRIQKVGMNLSTWRCPVRHHNKQVEYKFSCWDIVGQEDFFSTHDFFLSQRALYILVFNASKGDEDIKKLKPWLLNIKSQAQLAPVIVVGTHKDKIPEESWEIQKSFLYDCFLKRYRSAEYPSISDFVIVDARSPNRTINHLKQKIMAILENYKIRGERLMGEKQPASFIRLEEILLEEAKSLPEEYPIVKEKEIKDLVIRHKLNIDDDEFYQAIDFLNDSGQIAHIKGLNLQLQNLFFLNPQWICNMMIKVITMKTLTPFIKNGVMKVADFISIFKKHHAHVPLPSGTDIEIHAKRCLRILEKFCVALQWNEEELIIPSILNESEPYIPNLNETEYKIRRIFEFSFLSVGFWPRLITRICVLEKVFRNTCVVASLHLWQRGVIMLFKNHVSMVLRGKTENGKEIIDLAVTQSELGLKIFVNVIDNIDAFIEEWYPGLTDSDVKGYKMMCVYPVCPQCSTKFNMSDIILNASRSTHIQCIVCSSFKNTSGPNLRYVAPDVVMGDLPEELTCKPELLQLTPTKENILGSGGNGVVYKGIYNDQPCAIKYIGILQNNMSHQGFMRMNPPSYKLLRQEIYILQMNHHPSLMGLVAADTEKIILELAPLGDITKVMVRHKLSRVLIQRIVYQVAEGLQFLHQKGIIYRDLKPLNILIFSLNLSDTINAKLSDYGISRIMIPFGFVNINGTNGFQAPEVIDHSMSYNQTVDIFSYGITLFVIATRNHHPCELRTHWRPGENLELISSFGCYNWPYMQDLINNCLRMIPDERPNIETILNYVTSPVFVSVKTVVTLTRLTRVECCATLVTSDQKIKIIICNGNQFKQEVRYLDILSGTSKGKPFYKNSKLSRILSIVLYENKALLGTQNGQIWIYDYSEDDFFNTSLCLPDAVLSIGIMRLTTEVTATMFGLANGYLFYKINANNFMDLQLEDFNAIELSNQPISNIYISEHLCFVTCGSSIFRINYSTLKDKLEETKIIDVAVAEDETKLIKCFCVIKGNSNDSEVSFYFSLRNEALVYHHDESGSQLKPAINCEEIITQSNQGYQVENPRITSIEVWHNDRYLAVGTRSGHVLILDTKLNYSTVIHMFNHPVIFIQHITLYELKDKLPNDYNSEMESLKRKSSLILIGNGYKSIEEENEGASLVLMRCNVSRISRELNEHINNRKQL